MTSDMVERVAQAMREAVITDDEGEFPRLFDLLDFSGENKARTVVNGLARAAITAMREPTPAMIDRFVSRALSVSIHIAEKEAEIARLMEALTPSGDTKAAYIGEFKFNITLTDEDGEEYQHQVYVPWDTTKEIMKAISERAAIEEPSQ